MEEVIELSDSESENEQSLHALLHAEWAKENNAPYPASLSAEPEAATVNEMLTILEMSESYCRGLDYDARHPDCPSHEWKKPLVRLQSKLNYLRKAAMSSKWVSGFGSALHGSSMIRARPLHSSRDKELLRASDGRCMLCGAREHACQWAFDLASLSGRAGVFFNCTTEEQEQNALFDRDPGVTDSGSRFYGRFAAGKTCLRKAHLAFWAANFLPYLYEWMDEELARLCEREGIDALPKDEFCVATTKNATFFVKEIETAEHALRTDSATARLPELPLRFVEKWAAFDKRTRASVGSDDALQRRLGAMARETIRSGHAQVQTADRSDTEDDLVRSVESISRRTRARGAVPDSMCDDPDEHSREMQQALDASTEEYQRERRARDAAPSQNRKARLVVDSGTDEEDEQPKEGEGCLVNRGKRKRRVGRIVASDDEGSEDADRHDDGFAQDDTARAIEASLDTHAEEQCKSTNTNGAGCSSDGSIDLDATRRHAVHLLLAIGHEVAAEEMRKQPPNRGRAQQLSVEFAKRMACEFGLDIFPETTR